MRLRNGPKRPRVRMTHVDARTSPKQIVNEPSRFNSRRSRSAAAR